MGGGEVEEWEAQTTPPMPVPWGGLTPPLACVSIQKTASFPATSMFLIHSFSLI